MTRQVIYEIGSLRIGLNPTTTYFEVVDGYRRLSTYLNTLDEVPSLMTLLIETFMDEVVKHREHVEKLLEVNKKDLEEYKKLRMEREKQKYPKDYLKRLEDYIKRTEEKVEVCEKLIKVCNGLLKELDKCHSLLMMFIDLRSKL